MLKSDVNIHIVQYAMFILEIRSSHDWDHKAVSFNTYTNVINATTTKVEGFIPVCARGVVCLIQLYFLKFVI